LIKFLILAVKDFVIQSRLAYLGGIDERRYSLIGSFVATGLPFFLKKELINLKLNMKFLLRKNIVPSGLTLV